MAKTERPRLAVIGGGPVGIEAALAARKFDWAVTIYERGRVGEHLERWGHVKMFTPFGMNVTPLGLSILQQERPRAGIPKADDLLTGREHVAAYLTPLANSEAIASCLQTQQQVLAVGRVGHDKSDSDKRARQPFRLLLRDGQNVESTAEVDAVFDCTGVYGRHRHLGPGGMPAVGESAVDSQIAHGLEDILGGQKAKYAGKTVLLVGGGFTAATHAALLAQLAESAPETWTIWLCRSAHSAPLHRTANDPLRERERLAVRANSLATRGEGNIEFHCKSQVEKVVSNGQDKGFQVTARVDGVNKTWDVDRIIASVGYRPDSSLHRELQVQECRVNEGPAGGGPATTEPNYFILGSKSHGRRQQALLKDHFDQLRSALSSLTGKPAAGILQP